mmetsp:Transcript_17035/g.43492  ORF Transcript_17035/g.43492 Transcript_17035/m.43492 type:complete len:315 (-) Transcript_17035:116-1060(-)|eukprot:CAMPEP_0174242212 /NCGR_PEP_ID=MMETSP0417-20130205/26863_1 /TAXON_ID=242541 /ORGANISM="Mayorella sp, Strain BSH-02190019" /LENGTH=314 /DNA_ID=CAMNT_0015321577 /DNA_START=55 /DNA_END=999 /DNA_ORIENTATION=-
MSGKLLLIVLFAACLCAACEARTHREPFSLRVPFNSSDVEVMNAQLFTRAASLSAQPSNVKPSGVLKVTYSGAQPGQYLGLLKGSMINPGVQLTQSAGETFFSVSSFSSGTTLQLVLYDFAANKFAAPSKTITVSNSGGTFTVPPATPTLATSQQRQGWLAEHNTRRPANKQLVWASQLAQSSANQAAYLANQPGCGLVHSSGVGENLAVGQNNLAEVVEDWWDDEVPCYNAATKACKANCVCGHYTQAAWYSTEQIGCAQATCSQPASPYFNRDLFVCHYVRPGNCNGKDFTQTNSPCGPLSADGVTPSNWPN